MKRELKISEKKVHMNVRIFILLACFMLVNFDAYSQRSPEFDLKIKKKEFKTEKEEGFEEAWKAVKIGDKYFREGIGTYSIAREYFLKAHQYNSDNPVLNYFIGICYLYTDDKYEALEYMRKAYDRTPNLDPQIDYYLGRAYQLVLDFDKAIEHYKDYREKAVAMGNVNGAIMVDKRIIECQNGKELVNDPLRVIITNMGDSVNSIYDDYYPILLNNDSIMYFTSRRDHEKNKRNPYDNKFHENIYYSLNDDETWMGAEPITTKINKKDNNALVGISPDGNSLYVYDGNVNGGEIFRSDFNPEKKTWKKPKRVSKKLRSDNAEGSVFLTKNADTIYFISANEEMTEGGKDIFYSVKDAKGKWTEAKNLGALINTPYDEEGVFLTEDGRVMYFASKGHNSMGGFDIFYTYKLKDGTWADPVNVGYPVNTPDDEIFFHLRRNGKYAYFTAIREGGLGGKDIYKITFLGSEKELMLSSEDILIASLPDTIKTGFFEMPEKIAIDSFYYLTGKVVDKETGEPLMAKLEFIDIDNSEVISTAISVDSGNYTVKFLEPRKYGVEIMVKDYLFFLDVIDMTTASTDSATVRNFELEKIEVGARVVLENIYFETGKAILKEESFTQLNQIIKFLDNNESLKLEISGHTDNTGSLRLNTKLSKDRAKAVVDYLVANGIDPTRLEWE
ncbi:MAG: OmpA family protein, partial [Bacteroidales bacterium]